MGLIRLENMVDCRPAASASFEDRAFPTPVVRSGAPFPFNKIMPYDATGGEKLSRAYAQSAWVQRAIKKIAGPIAAVRLDFSLSDKAISDPDLEAYWEHPGLRLSRHDFIEATVGWLKLEGEAFWLMDDSALVLFDDVGAFPPLIVARPDRMFLKHHEGQVLGWDYVDSYGKHNLLLPEQVVHIRMWNPYDEFRGLSEFSAAKDAAEADFFAGKYAKNQFANNGDRGPYIIAEDGMPSDIQRQQIIDQLREKRELAQRGIYKPVFLGGNIRIEDAKAQAPDATFIAARLENRHEVALAFGVPPSMFDVKASYSIGSASDYYMLIAETCMPTSAKIAHGINVVLQRQTKRPLKASFNWDEHPVIQTVRRERAETGSKMFAMGVPLKTINDWLDLKLPNCPDWETGYVASTLVPVGTPPPDKNPELAEPTDEPAEDALDKMKRLLEPVSRLKSLLASDQSHPPAPSDPRLGDSGSCCSRAGDHGIKLRVTNAREMAIWRTLQAQRNGTRTAYQSKIGKVLKRVEDLQGDLEVEKAKAAALEGTHNQTAGMKAQGEQFDWWEKTKDAVEKGNATSDQSQQWNSLQRSLRNKTATAGQRDLWRSLQNADRAPADREAQDRAASTPGSGINVGEVSGQVALARAHVRTNKGNDSELNSLLNEIVGLTRDVHANAAQKTDLARLRAEVQQLQQEQQNHTQRLNQSGNV